MTAAATGTAARRGCALVGLFLCGALSPRAARATVSAERESEAGACVQAAGYFPEDQSAEAGRARRRCRLENMERAQAEAETLAETARREREARALGTWMERQGIPNRIMRRNSVDLFVSVGMASYGLAIGGLLRPSVEAEVWLGRASDSYPDYEANHASNRRNCLGTRIKWLVLEHGNVTPYVGLGIVGCQATLDARQFYNYSQGFPQLETTPGGEARAHLLTPSLGVAWMEKSGFRLAVDYTYFYAFYTRALTPADDADGNEALRQIWADQVATARHGLRLQVGYAF